jgi:hypothetical protein
MHDSAYVTDVRKCVLELILYYEIIYLTALRLFDRLCGLVVGVPEK